MFIEAGGRERSERPTSWLASYLENNTGASATVVSKKKGIETEALKKARRKLAALGWLLSTIAR